MGKLNIQRNNYKIRKQISVHPVVWGCSRLKWVWNNSHCCCVWLASDVICSQQTKYCGYTTVRGYTFVNASQFWFATLLFFLPKITSLKGFMMSKMTGVSPQTPLSWWHTFVSRWLTGVPELHKLTLQPAEKLRRASAVLAESTCQHSFPPGLCAIQAHNAACIKHLQHLQTGKRWWDSGYHVCPRQPEVGEGL